MLQQAREQCGAPPRACRAASALWIGEDGVPKGAARRLLITVYVYCAIVPRLHSTMFFAATHQRRDTPAPRAAPPWPRCSATSGTRADNPAPLLRSRRPPGYCALSGSQQVYRALILAEHARHVARLEKLSATRHSPLEMRPRHFDFVHGSWPCPCTAVGLRTQRHVRRSSVQRERERGSGRRASCVCRAGGSWRGQAAEARRGPRNGGRRAQEATQSLPAPAPEEHMQGVRGGKHLPAPASEERMQGVWGGEHLPAPAPEEHMQGVWGGEHLPAPEP